MATTWTWTFALDDGTVLRASIQLTTRVECVYLGDKLVSRLRKGSRTAHELVLQPSTLAPPVTAAYRSGADAPRRGQLVIDTRARSCTLTLDGTSVVPSSFAEVSGVARDGGTIPERPAEMPSRQRNLVIGGALTVLSAVSLAGWLLTDLDIHFRYGHHQIWTPTFVLGIVLAAVGMGFAAVGLWARRGDRD